MDNESIFRQSFLESNKDLPKGFVPVRHIWDKPEPKPWVPKGDVVKWQDEQRDITNKPK